MYEVDRKDKVIELTDVPQSSIGAPCPVVLADEYSVLLIYYLEVASENRDGNTIRVISLETEGEPVAIVKFNWCYAHMFGPPNDEAFEGHPLSGRGLGPYGAYEIENSSWVRKLEVMNSVHCSHMKSDFMEDKKHFIFSFHDSVFECVAKDFTLELSNGSVKETVSRLVDSLG